MKKIAEPETNIGRSFVAHRDYAGPTSQVVSLRFDVRGKQVKGVTSDQLAPATSLVSIGRRKAVLFRRINF